LAIDELESVVFLLHTEIERSIDVKERNYEQENLDISYSYCDWTCGKLDELSKIYLLISKNVILILVRLLLLILLFLYVIWLNPPLMMVTDLHQIQENWAEGESYPLEISAKNIGCDLLDANLIVYNSSKYIDARWSSDKNPLVSIASGDAKFIYLSTNYKIPPGKYTGFIIIEARAKRIIRFPIINHTFDIGLTPFKKLVEVPFFIKVTPKSNATVVYCRISQRKT
jgi:hypothetical protein